MKLSVTQLCDLKSIIATFFIVNLYLETEKKYCENIISYGYNKNGFSWFF